jgi:hypothetical protein
MTAILFEKYARQEASAGRANHNLEKKPHGRVIFRAVRSS